MTAPSYITTLTPTDAAYTLTPPGPFLLTMWAHGDVAGSIPRLLMEPDTLDTSICGSAGAQ